MFIIQRNGLRLQKSFFWWMGILTFGAIALTMHVHYCDPEAIGVRSQPSEQPPPIGFARKVLLLLVAIAMTVGGLFMILASLMLPIPLLSFFVSVPLASLGAYLLWDDFLSPLFGIMAKEK